MLGAVERRQRPFAAPTGVGIVDETRLPDGFNHLAERMVNNPILEWRSRDQTALPLTHHKGAVTSRLIRPGIEPLLQAQQPRFGIELISRDLRPATLAAPRRQIRHPQIIKAYQLRPEIAKGFRHRFRFSTTTPRCARLGRERLVVATAQDCSDAPLPLSAVRAHDAAPRRGETRFACGAGL